MNCADKKSIHIDDIIQNFSIYGCYYLRFLVLLFLALMTNGMYWSNYIFVVEEVGYKCKDESLSNATCQTINSTCKEWVYDNPDSFVAEFQLACQEWKRTLIGTMHCSGYMIGLLMMGPLSDRFGRKVILITSGVMAGVIGLIKSFVTNYAFYCVLSFLESTFGDLYSPTFLFALEMVAHKKRLISQMMCMIGSSLGGVMLSLLAWRIAYWRNLLRVMYTPSLFFISYILLLDESPRWLLSKGRKDRAVAIIEKTAKINKSQLEKNVLQNLTDKEKDKESTVWESLKSTFASTILLKRVIICLIWWISYSFVSTGMMVTSVTLPGNKYLNFAMTGLVEIPGYGITTFVLSKLKRKLPLIVCFMVIAILSLGQTFVPKSLPWLAVLLFLIGKLLCTICGNITFIYTCELFPTCVRNSMHALCSSLGNIGATVAPQTPLLMMYWPGLPSLAFSIASLIAGAATIFVPDMASESLPDTTKQAEALGMKTPVDSSEIKK